MIRTHEEFLSEVDAILARYITGGYEPEGKAECPGCREHLDGSLICCNPDAVAAHNKLRECNCSLRTKLVGDGCSVCNPEYAARFTQDETHGRDDETHP